MNAARFYAAEILTGLTYLHSVHVAHRYGKRHQRVSKGVDGP